MCVLAVVRRVNFLQQLNPFIERYRRCHVFDGFNLYFPIKSRRAYVVYLRKNECIFSYKCVLEYMQAADYGAVHLICMRRNCIAETRTPHKELLINKRLVNCYN